MTTIDPFAVVWLTCGLIGGVFMAIDAYHWEEGHGVRILNMTYAFSLFTMFGIISLFAAAGCYQEWQEAKRNERSSQAVEDKTQNIEHVH